MAVRYHSLAAKSDLLPQPHKITANSDDRTIIVIRHKKYPVEVIQFHLESINKKPYDIKTVENFFKL